MVWGEPPAVVTLIAVPIDPKSPPVVLRLVLDPAAKRVTDGPAVAPALWSKVQSMRELRRTRTPGRIVKRNYPLRLRCTGCQRFLYGDEGRYRHPAPTCETFIAATLTVRRRYSTGHDKRVQDHSYPQEWYEHAIGRLLEKVGGVDDHAITEVVRLYTKSSSVGGLVRVKRYHRQPAADRRMFPHDEQGTGWY